MKTTFYLIALLVLLLITGTMDFADQMQIEGQRIAMSRVRGK